MRKKNAFPTNNHKDHFIYENRPFINPDHGELDPIEWATIIDISLIPTTTPGDDDIIDPPRYYLQITPNGEIRGATHYYDEHQDYFSVTADDSDIVFLKLFLSQHPHHTPTLASLQHYRKERVSEWKNEVNKQKNHI